MQNITEVDDRVKLKFVNERIGGSDAEFRSLGHNGWDSDRFVLAYVP